MRLIQHWTLENISYLLKVYQDSKKSLNNTNTLDRINKRVREQIIRERANSPESVMRRQIRSAKRRP